MPANNNTAADNTNSNSSGDSNSSGNNDSIKRTATLPAPPGTTKHTITFEAKGIDLFPGKTAYDYAQTEAAIKTAFIKVLEEELGYFPDDVNVTAECAEGVGVNR